MSTAAFHLCPPCLSAFFPTALFMFPTQKQERGSYLLYFVSEENLGTLSLAAVKTRILSPSTTIAVCWSSSKEGGCWDAFASCLLAASCETRCRSGALLDQLLCLEEAPQVKHLPRGQPDQTTHGEHAEVEDTRVGGLWKSERIDKVLTNTMMIRRQNITVNLRLQEVILIHSPEKMRENSDFQTKNDTTPLTFCSVNRLWLYSLFLWESLSRITGGVYRWCHASLPLASSCRQSHWRWTPKGPPAASAPPPEASASPP